MPHQPFDVIAENPQIKHVAKQMQEAAVQKHRREQARQIHALRDIGGNSAVSMHEPLQCRCRQRQLINEDSNIANNQTIIDKRRYQSRIIVFEWYQFSSSNKIARVALPSSRLVWVDGFILPPKG